MTIAGKATITLQDSPKNLRELFDRQVEFAHMIFKKQGEILPMWVGQDAEGILYPMTATFEDQADKERTVKDIRTIFQRHNVIRYAAMVEAWMVVGHKDDLENLKEMRPSKHPDRKEVVWVMAHEQGGQQIVGQLDIKRDKDGNGTLTDVEVHDDANHIGGLFSDVLPDPKVTGATLH